MCRGVFARKFLEYRNWNWESCQRSEFKTVKFQHLEIWSSASSQWGQQLILQYFNFTNFMQCLGQRLAVLRFALQTSWMWNHITPSFWTLCHQIATQNLIHECSKLWLQAIYHIWWDLFSAATLWIVWSSMWKNEHLTRAYAVNLVPKFVCFMLQVVVMWYIVAL
jgi:hypothetical protein